MMMEPTTQFPRVYRSVAAAVRLSSRSWPYQAKPLLHGASIATRSHSTTAHSHGRPPPIDAPLPATDPASAADPVFVASVHRALSLRGMARVRLSFSDPESAFLSRLVRSFHALHGHRLPITHSASRGWFWDVRPSSDGGCGSRPLQTANHRARSETMADFPWHTDCSYEAAPPRFFGLHVLQHDRRGGGTLSAMNIERLGEALSPGARRALAREEFEIAVPPEFVKDPGRRGIVGGVMATTVVEGGGGGGGSVMRYRRDLLRPRTAEAAAALRELDGLLDGSGSGPGSGGAGSIAARSTVHLTAEDCPSGTIILMDNRRWLHARNHIKDPDRHLRRIRWDAIPFPGE